MADGHARDRWGRWSVLLALTANCHRDPKRGRAYRPSDFDPAGREPREVVEVNEQTIGILKDAFLQMHQPNLQRKGVQP